MTTKKKPTTKPRGMPSKTKPAPVPRAAKASPLFYRLDEARALGFKPDAVTVLSDDPYRFGTPRHHDEAQWLAERLPKMLEGRSTGRIHIRGMHYGLLGETKPNGSVYVNDEANWLWLSEDVAAAARWLGYVPFSAILDARNSAPTIHHRPARVPEWLITADGLDLTLPSAEAMLPRFTLRGDLGLQPVQQVLVAEKSGVGDLLLPICQRYDADLVLPTGEVSTTLLAEIVSRAAADSRPLVVHQLGDCDPAGHQMAVSTARKLQGIRDMIAPDLQISVYPIGLTVQQARDWGLPATPLKAGEGRADRWMAAFGHEQTELDAAVMLAPEPFAKVVADALKAHFDTGLEDRARAEKHRLEDEANAILDAALGDDTRAAIHAGAEAALDVIRQQLDALMDLTIDPSDVGVEVPAVPEPMIGTGRGKGLPVALLDTANDDWAANSIRLLARKRY